MPVFVAMAGIPGSGKSTVAERIAREEGALLVSTDRLREELTGDAADRSQDYRVFPRAFSLIQGALAKGQSVVYDATNLARHERRRVLKLAPTGTHKVCCYLKTSKEEAFARNLARERVVPVEVIEEMARRFEEPRLDEGWDEIRVLKQGEET